jgi:hypothetical protein
MPRMDPEFYFPSDSINSEKFCIISRCCVIAVRIEANKNSVAEAAAQSPANTKKLLMCN